MERQSTNKAVTVQTRPEKTHLIIEEKTDMVRVWGRAAKRVHNTGWIQWSIAYSFGTLQVTLTNQQLFCCTLQFIIDRIRYDTPDWITESHGFSECPWRSCRRSGTTASVADEHMLHSISDDYMVGTPCWLRCPCTLDTFSLLSVFCFLPRVSSPLCRSLHNTMRMKHQPINKSLQTMSVARSTKSTVNEQQHKCIQVLKCGKSGNLARYPRAQCTPIISSCIPVIALAKKPTNQSYDKNAKDTPVAWPPYIHKYLFNRWLVSCKQFTRPVKI